MKHAVVYDLELVKRFKKGQPSEIVEIGACKVDLSTLRVVEEFQIYIMPGSGYFSKSTRSFINMSREDAEKAVPFRTGISRFADWVGEDAYLCSWGRDDKLHIVNECVRKGVPLDWFRNYNDIQRDIGRLLTEQKGQLGLKNALELAGIEPVGKAHRGIDDARNTAELLIRFADRLALMRNELSEKELHPELHKTDKPRTPGRSRGGRNRTSGRGGGKEGQGPNRSAGERKDSEPGAGDGASGNRSESRRKTGQTPASTNEAPPADASSTSSAAPVPKLSAQPSSGPASAAAPASASARRVSAPKELPSTSS